MGKFSQYVAELETPAEPTQDVQPTGRFSQYVADIPPEMAVQSPEPIQPGKFSEYAKEVDNPPPQQPRLAATALQQKLGLDQFLPPPTKGPVVPELRNENWQPPVPQQESSATGSFLRSAAMATFPTATGIVASRPGGALGAKLGTKVAMELGTRAGLPLGPYGAAGGAIVGGLLGYFGGDAAGRFIQDWALPKILSPETRAALDAKLKADAAQHPIAQTLGSMVPQAVAFRPSTENINAAARLIRGVSGEKSIGEYAMTPEGQKNLVAVANMLFGFGTPVAQDVITTLRGGDVDATQTVLRSLAGIVLSKQTPVGRALTGVMAKANATTAPEIQKMAKSIQDKYAPVPGETPGQLVQRTLAKQVASEEPGVLPRKFLTRSENAPDIPIPVLEELKAVEPQTYEQTKTSQVLNDTKAWIGSDPKNVTTAETQVYDDSPVSAKKGVLGVALLEKYRADGNVDAEVKLTEHLDTQFREAGRFIQAASFWNKLSGSAWTKAFDKLVEKNGVTLPRGERLEVHNKLLEAARLPEGEARDSALRDAVDFAATKVPLRFGEWLDAYRYQNMLSGPQTSQRNTFTNLFNAMVTRPASLLWQRDPKGMATYMKNATASLGKAWDAARTAMSDLSKDPRWSEFGQLPAMEAARMKQMPQSLTMVSRFMEAQDIFVRTMIAQGETARLIKAGMKPEMAQTKGEALGQEYMLRNELGKDAKNKNQSLAVRALDSIGSLLSGSRNLPVVGKGLGWFIPFVRTPINWAKMGVQASPLGYIGTKKIGGVEVPWALTKEQIGPERRALAGIGTMVTLAGTIAAATGRTTWKPPRDPQEREEWYASGRKPYSILIGNQWVPMWYFGPFGFALAIPAAARDAWNDNPRSAGRKWYKNMASEAAGLAGFFVNQTPLQGVSSFMKLINGEEAYTIPRILAFTSEQMIPASGLVRWVNSVVDPTFRKADNFQDTLKRDIPWLSQSVPARKDAEGQPAQRALSDSLLPFAIGTRNPEYEKRMGDRNAMLKNREANNAEALHLADMYQRGKVQKDDVYTIIGMLPDEEQQRIITMIVKRYPDTDLFGALLRRTAPTSPIEESFVQKQSQVFRNAAKRIAP